MPNSNLQHSDDKNFFVRERKHFRQYVAATSASLSALATASVVAWTANISVDLKEMSFNGIEIDDESLSWLSSFAMLGSAIICIPLGKICDVVGIKKGVLLLLVPIVIGWFLIIFANYLWMIYVGRFLTGMGSTAYAFIYVMYVCEITEKHIRGRLLSLFGIILTLGGTIVYALAILVDIKTYTIILSTWPLIFTVIFMFQPESPVYLMKVGREESARSVLKKLRQVDYNVTAEIEDIKAMLQRERNAKISFFSSLSRKSTKKAISISFLLIFFRESVGLHAILYYTDYIFTSANTNLDPKLSTIILGLVQVVGAAISTATIDKFGRKLLLNLSCVSTVISHAALAIFFTLKERDLVSLQTLSTLSFIPLISLSVFLMTSLIGIASIPFNIAGEILPSEIKGVVSGAATTFSGIIGFVIGKSFITVKNAAGSDVCFYIFSVMAAVTVVYVVLFVPETKGKTLHEIQLELSGDKKSVP